MNIEKLVPKNEKVWVSYLSKGSVKYIIVSKILDRSTYYLYEIKNGKLSKVSKNANPLEFEKLIVWD